MQLTIYYKESDSWLIEKIEAKAYGERKSVSQVILSSLEEHVLSQGDGTIRPFAPRMRRKPGPLPGSKRMKGHA